LRQVAPMGRWLADAEVGAAAAIDPQAALVETPRVAADAGRAADLAYKLDIAAVAYSAPVSFPVVGGAGDDTRMRWWRWGTRTADEEFGSATTVDPKAALVQTPGVAADAGRAADLADELDIAAVADGAPVSFPIVGGAGDPLGLTVSRLTVSGLEGRSRGGGCNNGGRSESNGHHQKKFRCACHLASFEMKIVAGFEVRPFWRRGYRWAGRLSRGIGIDIVLVLQARAMETRTRAPKAASRRVDVTWPRAGTVRRYNLAQHAS